jgi:hypothetical protein
MCMIYDIILMTTIAKIGSWQDAYYYNNYETLIIMINHLL